MRRAGGAFDKAVSDLADVMRSTSAGSAEQQVRGQGAEFDPLKDTAPDWDWRVFWLELTTSHDFDCAKWVVSFFKGIYARIMRLSGPMMMLFLNGVVLVVHRLFFTLLLPLLAERLSSPLWHWFHWCAGQIFAWQLLGNYWLCALSDPGFIPPNLESSGNHDHDPTRSGSSNSSSSSSSSGGYADGQMLSSLSSNHPPHHSTTEEGASVCKRCDSLKPPRAHHCRICGRCVVLVVVVVVRLCD
jgi:hypothetical protein